MTTIFRLALVLTVGASLVHCGPPRTHDENTRTTVTSSGGTHAGTPRMDLHCTPQNDGDEAACHARGAEYQYGPAPIGHGTQPPPEVEEAERRAYAEGTGACVCMSQQERMQVMMVP